MNPKTALDPVEALERLLDRYVGLVNCGDCGNWDPETEDEVIAARAALTAARSAAEAVPVAWRRPDGLGGHALTMNDRQEKYEGSLYAHPLPAKSEGAEVAIDFALKVELYKGEGDIFLRLWRTGDYQKIAEDFPEFKGMFTPAAAVEGWREIASAPTDDSQFLVRNVAGFMAIATHVTADGAAYHWTPEGEDCVCSGVEEWRPIEISPAAPGLQWEAVAGAIADELQEWTERGGSSLDRECLAARSVSHQIAALLPEPQRAEFVKLSSGQS